MRFILKVFLSIGLILSSSYSYSSQNDSFILNDFMPEKGACISFSGDSKQVCRMENKSNTIHRYYEGSVGRMGPVYIIEEHPNYFRRGRLGGPSKTYGKKELMRKYVIEMVQYGFTIEDATNEVVFSYEGGSFEDFTNEFGSEPDSGPAHGVAGILLALLAIFCAIVTGDPFCGNKTPDPKK